MDPATLAALTQAAGSLFGGGSQSAQPAPAVSSTGSVSVGGLNVPEYPFPTGASAQVGELLGGQGGGIATLAAVIIGGLLVVVAIKAR